MLGCDVMGARRSAALVSRASEEAGLPVREMSCGPAGAIIDARRSHYSNMGGCNMHPVVAADDKRTRMDLVTRL